VPAVHTTDAKLPAVSGSSGRLVVQRPAAETTETTWPGRVFDDPEMTYADAMAAFVAASTATAGDSPEGSAAPPDAPRRQEGRRALRQEDATLRAQRRAVRQRRAQDDALWRTQRAEHRAALARPGVPAPVPPPVPDSVPVPDVSPAAAVPWDQRRAQRHAECAQRQAADALWRQQRLSLRARGMPRLVTAWIAVLVVTDNCTRRCCGLPLFVAGAKITADVVVAALRVLLPPDLQFLISDRGVHFTAQVFEQLAHEQHFIHVLIARHRPESNGIAERFVRTLKEWLADTPWASADDLAALLARFLAEYNERPHQGLAIPGLSPNEFAQRIGLL
jgi:transposase InsO family protein